MVCIWLSDLFAARKHLEHIIVGGTVMTNNNDTLWQNNGNNCCVCLSVVDLNAEIIWHIIMPHFDIMMGRFNILFRGFLSVYVSRGFWFQGRFEKQIIFAGLEYSNIDIKTLWKNDKTLLTKSSSCLQVYQQYLNFNIL